MFDWGSSAVDWCETNFSLSIYVAEFFNSVSNLSYIMCAAFGLKYLKVYFDDVNRTARWVFYLLLIIGISSTYFHATLSLFGQMLDELSIVWVLAVGYCVWLPETQFSCTNSRSRARKVIIAAALIVSCLSFVYPVINAYVLMCSAPPTLLLMFLEVRRSHNSTASTLAVLTIGLWTTAIAVWCSDRFSCGFWKRIDFPYLHAIWHLVSGYASYVSVLLLSYLEVLKRNSNFMTAIVWKWRLIPTLKLQLRETDSGEKEPM